MQTTTTSTATVYGLFDPELSRLRYIGITINPLERRLSQHIREINRPGCARRRREWIVGLLASGRRPQIRALAIVDRRLACDCERVTIARAKQHGYDLVNGTSGGQGILGHKFTAESRAKMSASQKARKREPWSDEVKQKMADARRRHWQNPENRARLVDKMWGRPMSEKTKSMLALANQTPEYRAKFLAGLKTRRPRGPQTQAAKEKIAEAARRRWERKRQEKSG